MSNYNNGAMTGNGGTSLNSSAFTMSVKVGPSVGVIDPAQASAQNPATGKLVVGEPAAVWVGLLILLVSLKALSELKSREVFGEEVNPGYIKIAGYNVAAIGLVSVVFIIALKVLSAYLPFTSFKSFAAAI